MNKTTPRLATIDPDTTGSMSTPDQTIRERKFSQPWEIENFLRSALYSIPRLSEAGDLPLFTWTLGLPQRSLVTLLEELSLPSWQAEFIPENEYAVIEKMAPQTFNTLRRTLIQHRTQTLDVIHADYLSRAIAAACFGSRQLWQDLGLKNDGALKTLLSTFFQPLYQKNKRNTRWKRFLFSELHETPEQWSSIREMLLKCVIQRQ